VPVSGAAQTKKTLARALGITKKVFMKRLVCFVGRTRVHFDEVRGLGRFIELEVVLETGDTLAGGRREAASLMKALGIKKADLLAGAYADLQG
jgi:predicted adenylyl cyclase CyaB